MKRLDLKSMNPNRTTRINANIVFLFAGSFRKAIARTPRTIAANEKPEFLIRVQDSYGYHSLPTFMDDSP